VRWAMPTTAAGKTMTLRSGSVVRRGSTWLARRRAAVCGGRNVHA
jgi:hypothetical protein